MSRYVKDLPTQMNRDQASWVITQYLTGQGFKYKDERGEMCWRKGVGWAAPQFVKAEPGDGVVHIEAWIAGLAIVPGVYMGEQDLEGVYGFAIKAALKSRLAELEQRLSGPPPVAAAPAPGPAPAP